MQPTSTTVTPGSRRERAAIVRLNTRALRGVDTEAALDELAGLVHAAGADVLLRVSQDRDLADSATLIGRGQGRDACRRG